MPRRSSRQSARRRRQRRIQKAVIVTLSVLLTALVLSTVWVTVRGLMAREQLLGAYPTAVSIRASILSGDIDKIEDEVGSLQNRSAEAASLTSDPIWRAMELLPLFGDNLRVIRQAAAVANEISETALPPLTDLANQVTLADLVPVEGRFDLAAFTTAAPALAQARDAVTVAAEHASEIDTSTSLPPVADAVDQLVEIVNETRSTVDGLDAAVTLLPQMLGEGGAQRYLLMSLNSAELRSSGGIPGALAVITADQGVLSMGENTSASSLGRFDPPAVPQTESELALFQGLTGAFMQDVNLTPQFDRAAETARAMWEQRQGTPIDGVIAVDPVALGYILAATGPVEVGNGVVIDSTNAVKVLISDVYQAYPDPAAQDAFFAQVTQRVFAAITSGAADSSALLGALMQATEEHRIHLWSSEPTQQEVIGASTLGGTLPESTDEASAFGIYLNDRTESKMDYYLGASGDVGGAVCRSDLLPTYRVGVTLTSSAPADAGSALPQYVTGAGVPGRALGVIATNVFVYAPEGFLAFSVKVDGVEQGFSSAVHADRSVVGIDVLLDPGQEARLEVLFLGERGDPTEVTVQATPMATPFPIELGGDFTCPTVNTPGDEIDARAPERSRAEEFTSS